MYNKLVGVVSASFLLSTIQFLYFSRIVMLDVTASLFILLSVFLYYLASEKYANRTRYYLLLITASGASIGLSILTKAVVGLIPIGIIVTVTVYQFIVRKKFIPITSVLLFIIGILVVAAPWHIISVLLHDGKFIKVYFIHHMFDRGVRGLGHERPTWWYLDVILSSFRYWTFPALIGIFLLPFYDKLKRIEYTYLLVSIVIILTIFSMSEDKLVWYITPIYPYLAIVAGRVCEQLLLFVKKYTKHSIFRNVNMRAVSAIFTLVFVTVYIVKERTRVYTVNFNKEPIEDCDVLAMYL
jgi:4-amino-4-deoxy-L-arabinose transferase-like glycosyltransferase